jgi:hypothetical protein
MAKITSTQEYDLKMTLQAITDGIALISDNMDNLRKSDIAPTMGEARRLLQHLHMSEVHLINARGVIAQIIQKANNS